MIYGSKIQISECENLLIISYESHTTFFKYLVSFKKMNAHEHRMNQNFLFEFRKLQSLF